MKKNTKKARAAARASKRRRVSEKAEDSGNEDDPSDTVHNAAKDDGESDGTKWECVAVTLSDYQDFLATIRRSRDANEKAMYQYITEEVLPVLETVEESKRKEAARKEKELMNMERLAMAKRSSRIASKLEHQRQAEEAAEAERKRQAELAMARKEQDRLKKLEDVNIPLPDTTTEAY
jgi:hypothetical protein